MHLNDKTTSNIFLLFYVSASLLGYFFLSDYFSYGDVSRYLQGEGVRGNNIVASTAITDYYFSLLVRNFGNVGTYFINLTTSALLFKQLLKVIPKYASIFFLFPGIVIWISVPSKESLIFQLIALTLILNSSISSNLIKILTLYLLVIFKPTLGFFALLFYFFLKTTNGSRNDYLKLLLMFLAILLAFWAYFNYFNEQVDTLFTQIGWHFSIFANTNVNYPIYETYSFFYNIPEGFVRLLFSAFPSESLSFGFFTTYIFIESFACFMLICYLFLKSLYELPNSQVIIIFVCFLALVIVYYPFAFYNIGSAWRYKTSFILYFLLFFLNFKKKKSI